MDKGKCLIGFVERIIGNQDLVYTVFCVDTHGEKSDNSSASVFVRDYNINDVIVFPNPTTRKITIKSRGCISGALFKLWTIKGELLYEGAGNEQFQDRVIIDLFDLPSAEYILQIIGNDNGKEIIISKRIVKFNLQ